MPLQLGLDYGNTIEDPSDQPLLAQSYPAALASAVGFLCFVPGDLATALRDSKLTPLYIAESGDGVGKIYSSVRQRHVVAQHFLYLT